MRVPTWSTELLSEGIKLIVEVAGLLLALCLIGLRSSGVTQRWRWVDTYSREVEFLGPLLVWLVFVLAFRWAFSFSLETLVLTAAGVVYVLWLLRARRRDAETGSRFSSFCKEVDYPVTLLAGTIAKMCGARIVMCMPPSVIEQFKELAMEAMLRHFSLYVYGDERALKILEGLRQRFPRQPPSRLAHHALYTLQNAYGPDRFSTMLTAFVDAYEKTSDANKDALSAITAQAVAGLDSGHERVDDLVKQLEPLKLRDQLQEAFRKEIIALVGYDMRPKQERQDTSPTGESQ